MGKKAMVWRGMKINVQTILIVAVCVLLALRIESCFHRTPVNETMIRNEVKLQALEEKRLSDSVTFAAKIKWYDSLLSVSQQMSLQLASKYQATKVIYEKIPVIVDNLDKEQLRAGANSY